MHTSLKWTVGAPTTHVLVLMYLTAEVRFSCPLSYGVQCCRVPKSVLLKDSQAEISRFYRTCQPGNLKGKNKFWKVGTEVAQCTGFMHTCFIAGKKVTWLELRKLRTTPGCDSGPHILRHPTVLWLHRYRRARMLKSIFHGDTNVAVQYQLSASNKGGTCTGHCTP